MSLLVYAGACQPPAPGGGQTSTSDRSVTSAPFAEGESWILTSDTTTGQSGLAYPTISGVGNVVSSIAVVTNVFTSQGCNIQSLNPPFINQAEDTPSPSPTEFEFDGASMSISAIFQGDEFTVGCSVEFTASVAARGTEQALFGINVFDVSIQGQALVSGEPVLFAPVQLNRFRTPKPIACEVPPTDLEGSSFSINNVQPGTSFFAPPSSDARMITIDVFDGRISSVSLSNGGFSGCSGSEGAFSFDGTDLEIESSFPAFVPPPFDPACNDVCEFAFNAQCDDGREGAASSRCPADSDCFDCGVSLETPLPVEEGQDGNGGEGEIPDVEPTMCSVAFSGKVAECGAYLSPFGFTQGQEVLTIKGSGSFSDGEGSGELTTVYLSIHRNATVP